MFRPAQVCAMPLGLWQRMALSSPCARPHEGLLHVHRSAFYKDGSHTAETPLKVTHGSLRAAEHPLRSREADC